MDPKGMMAGRWSGLLLLPMMMMASMSMGQDSYYFHPHPRDRDVMRGAAVTLGCGVSNARHVTFYWTLNGETLPNTTRRHQAGSDLRIARADPALDAGEFKCIATNVTTGISLASRGARINVLWIGEQARVQLQSPPSAADIRSGGEMSLRCKVEGSGDLRFEWFHNGVRMFRDDRVAPRGRRLHVAHLTARDNGVYSCHAQGEAGEVDSADNFALLLHGDDGAARIRVLPRDVLAALNGSARFDCAYDDAAALEWYAHAEDVPLANSSRVGVFPNGTLLIREVSAADEGVYRCVGISRISKEAPQQTYAARLRTAHLDAFGDSPFDPPVGRDELKVVALGSHFEVSCVRPPGRPPPLVRWEDPAGRPLPADGGLRLRAEGAQLVVEGARKEDTGNYTCVAENVAGRQSTSLYFYVAAAPTLSSQPSNVLCEEGEPASFVCEFVGSPYPVTTVRWLRGGRVVKGGDVFPHNGTLLIRAVDVTDAGDYACEVVTDGFPPVRSESATLFVKERLKFVPPPVSKRLELGSHTKIYCRARGASGPVVRWRKEGQPFFDWPPHVRDDNGTLSFAGVSHEDAGRYTCVATNSQGIINTTISVDVVVMPRFEVEPVDTQAYEGYPTMLHCVATGDPPPTVQWDKNNVLDTLDPGRFRVMVNGTLYVTEVHMEDGGKYGCTAGNSGGFRRAEVHLSVKSAEYYSPNNSGGSDENTMTKTVTVTLSCATLYMFLVIGLMVFCKIRRAQKKARLLAADVAKSENVPCETEMSAMAVRIPLRSSEDGEGTHSSGSTQHSKRSRTTSCDRSQHFPRQQLQTMMLLGHGEYGEVFLAKAKGITDAEADETVVMVKALQTREEGAHLEYRREMEMLGKLHHENIACLLGTCRDSEPFLLITEYSDWGDLKQFLLATRRDNPRKGPRPPPLNVPQILGVCHQVATGMEHLSNRRFTHTDLATRNCLVTSRLSIKIAFPSLSRDTYAEEYYVHRNRTVPLRWAPAEAVLEDEWSTKSDVWSFAVLVWELFTRAELPFPQHTDDRVLGLLATDGGLGWGPPDGVPPLLGSLLMACWSASPRDRPTFTDVVYRLSQVTVDSHL